MRPNQVVTAVEPGDVVTFLTDKGTEHTGEVLAFGTSVGWVHDPNHPAFVVLAPQPYIDHVVVIPSHRIVRISA